MTIYDGGSSTSSGVGKYCGDSIPPSHVSSSNEVFIRFLSDGQTYGGGGGTNGVFQIEYIPTGNISIQNNTEFFGDYYRELWEFPNY